MNCPKCGSIRIIRSHSRGFQEQFKKLFHQRAYLCKNCNWRGILKDKTPLINPEMKIKILYLIIFSIIIIAILSFAYLYADKRYNKMKGMGSFDLFGRKIRD